MAFPVDNTLVNLTGKFGYRAPFLLPNGKTTRSLHGGVDLAPEVKGTKLNVYAIGRGKIVAVGRRADAGRYIIIRLQDNSLWRYCHLDSYKVEAGDEVVDGQHIGQMGTTGNSTGVHLHIERYPDGQLNNRVDPWPFIVKERNPVTYAINGGTHGAPKAPAKPKPAPSKAKAPAARPLWETPVNRTMKLAEARTAYRTWQAAKNRRPAYVRVPAGSYKIVGASNGQFRIQGRIGGRYYDAWVSDGARAGVR